MISTSFVGVAFLIISIILGVTGLANASRWWFWLLIPAFAMLGTGLAQYIQLKKSEQKHIPQSEPETVKSFNQTSNANLPPSQTEYVAPDSRYKTGDLVPPSVAEGTTRHLEINSEGETMTLPKK
jgi:ABC-type multidrug transport system permease subunit